MKYLTRFKFQRNLSILILALTGLIASSNGMAQNAMQPILTLNYGNAKTIPLIEEGLRDPTIAKYSIYDRDGAADKMAEIRVLKTELAASRKSKQKSRRVRIYSRLMNAYGALAYYYADIQSGKIANESRSSSNYSKQKRNQVSLIKYADLYKKSSRGQTTSASRASYLVHTTRYLIGSNRSASIKALRYLLNKKKGKLNGYLTRRASFLVAKWDVDRRRSKEVIKLASLISGLPRPAAVAARLTIARYYAGINRNGRKARSADKKYRSYLVTATRKSGKLTRSQRQKVLSVSIAIWRLAEGKQSTWSRPPMNFANYTGFSEPNAIYERQALNNWKKGNISSSINQYKVLSKRFASKKQMSTIDRRILALEEGKYLKIGKFKTYESTILSIRSKYSSDHAQDSKATLMVNNAVRRHGKLVHSELASASSTKTAKSKRIKTIGLANRYLTKIEDNRETEKVQSKIARLWVLNNTHKHAVRIYLLLANEIAPNKKSNYLTLAITSQRVLAKWPKTAPWNRITLKRSNDRRTLLSIYKDLNSTRTVTDWFLLSHIGQLHINLNDRDAAFAVWETALLKAPKGAIAAKASGLMLITYKSGKHWQKLENLARLCRAKKLVPRDSKNRSINSSDMLALALLEGGKQALASSKYDVAVKKLKEFVREFRAKNRDQGMFLLATSFRGNAQHKFAIETLSTFSEEYPRSKYFRQAMLNGGDWSVPMAFEENAMFFYKTFVERFPSDNESTRVREELADLYIGRRLYAEGATILKGKIASKKTSREEKQTASIRLIRMEERHGSKSRATRAAENLLKTSKNQTVRAEALATKARDHGSKGQISQLVKIERELDRMDERPAVQESLGETRFLLATAKLTPILVPMNSLTLKDPKKALATRFRAYQTIKSSYTNVCNAGETSYCVPALHRVGRIAERLITIVEDVTIPATLPEKTIKAFDSKKEMIINELSKDTIASDERAASLIDRGYTNPEWTQQVYWQNSSDVNFERVSGESGRAYFQWPVSEEK